MKSVNALKDILFNTKVDGLNNLHFNLDAVKTINILIDRDTAIDVIHPRDNGTSYSRCSKCSNILYPYYNFCNMCGQKLDWRRL